MANKFNWCNHPHTQGKGIGEPYVPVDVHMPEWCPLKSESVTISIKQP